jgi:serine/threonine protein kinase
MSAIQLFPRIVDFVSDHEALQWKEFDPTNPIQSISEKPHYDLTLLYRLVQDTDPPVAPGRKFTFFLRDLLLTLQDHPAIVSTKSWNVDLKNEFKVYSIVSRSDTEICVSTSTPLDGTWDGTEEEALIIVYGVARVLSLLHSHGICHGNLHANFVFLEKDTKYPRVGDFGWLRQVDLGRDATKIGDISSLHDMCQFFLTDREEGGMTPVGLFKEWLETANGEEATAGYLGVLETLITDKYPKAIEYRNYLNKSICEFHETFLGKLEHLEALIQILEDPAARVDLETQLVMAVLFFVIPDIKPDEIRKLVVQQRNEDPQRQGMAKDFAPHLFEYLRTKRHLPKQIIGSTQSYYPFHIRDNRPSVLGHRFFELIKSLSEFNTTDDIFAGGSQGRVFRGTLKSDDTVKVVIKKLKQRPRRGTLNESISVQGQEAVAFFRELLCLLLCVHPSVIHMVGWNITPYEDTEFLHITLYVEKRLVIGNDDDPKLEMEGLIDTVKLKIAYGIARAMKHLHDLKVLHRDLKLANILWGPNGPELGDLGWSKAGKPGDPNTCNRGTPCYMAPEVLAGSQEYDFSVDVYSYGICLWELVYGKLWFTELRARNLLTNFHDLVTTKGLRPKYQTVSPTLDNLFHYCFGADIVPEQRYKFERIVQIIEEDASRERSTMFPRADLTEFTEYKQSLDREPTKPRDENLMYLLEKLRKLDPIVSQIQDLPIGSPTVERILCCLGRLFGNENHQNEDVVLIARYQFATKRCLEGCAFLAELEAFEHFPGDRCKFPLADFLINPEGPLGPDQELNTIEISNRNDLFRALRNILAGICCSHPCVLKFHAWSIRKFEEKWIISIVTDKAAEFSIAKFNKWNAPKQAKFLLTLAIGMVEIHSRGVLHNNLRDTGSIRVQNGRAQIYNFGLLDERPSFFKDTESCNLLFRQAKDEFSRLERPIFRFSEENEENEENDLHELFSLHGYVEDALKREAETQEGASAPCPLKDLFQSIKDAAIGDFPFDLFFHLVDSRNSELWQSKDEPLDVASALASLTRGLDEAKKERFKNIINETAQAQKWLTADLFDGL